MWIFSDFFSRGVNMPMQAAWGGLQMQPGQQQQYNGQQQGVLGYPMQQGQ